MRFNCGLALDDRIKANETWHRCFAWYPVRVGNEWCWLECVERKYEYLYGGPVLHYRNIPQGC